jgi:hypothetical protein
MKIEVNEFYLNAIGEIVKIKEAYDNSHFLIKDFYYYDESDNSYFESGQVTGDVREFDLIAHIPKELHHDLIKRIEAYNTNDNYKRYCDKNLVH